MPKADASRPRRTGWGGAPVPAATREELEAAAALLAGVAVRTPLVPLRDDPDESDIWLKPEVLQPSGSFKIRGVYNWAAQLEPDARARGLTTTSAGNTAQALGHAAQVLGVTARSLVPEWLPDNKATSLERFGVSLVRVPFDELLDYMFEERWRDEPYSYLNPWGAPDLVAGHGTMAAELLEDLPDVRTVFVPVGGGGLIAGVGGAIKQLAPSVRVHAVQTAANPALQAALDAGRSVWIDWTETLSEGTSVPIIVDEMLPLVRSVVDDLVLVTEDEIRAAMRRLAVDQNLVAEGAGALALAGALTVPHAVRGRSVCIVSGGSVDAALMADILG